jgi:hemerythrin
MQWSKDFIIGIDEIDSQHKKLVEKVNSFKLFWETNPAVINSEIGKTLTFLVNYTQFHFTTEERFMERTQYTDILVHKEKHQKLENQLHTILLRIKRNESFKPLELYYFLENWITEHILESDKNFGSYYKSYKKRVVFNIDTPSDIYNYYLKPLEKENSENSVYLSSISNFYKDYDVYDDIKMIIILVQSIGILQQKGLITQASQLESLRGILWGKVNIKKLRKEDPHKGITTYLDPYKEEIAKYQTN